MFAKVGRKPVIPSGRPGEFGPGDRALSDQARLDYGSVFRVSAGSRCGSGLWKVPPSLPD